MATKSSNLQASLDPMESLKHLTKLAANGGFSYAAISDCPEARSHWNQNSLKQFVNRNASSRKNEKTKSLALVIYRYFIENGDKYSNNNIVQQYLISVSDEFFYDDRNEKNNTVQGDTGITEGIFSKIDSVFSAINNSATKIRLPSHFMFCRYSIDGEYIVLIRIDIYSDVTGSAFTMKISGSNGRRRFVLGNISSTLSNTYFTGVAFSVSEYMDEGEFMNYDFLNGDKTSFFVSDNPVGQELIAVSNHSFYNTEFPVCFSGLDGRGDPIGGIGLFLNQNVFDKYGVDIDHISTVRCSDQDSEIFLLMKKMKASTLSLRLSEPDA